MRCLEPAERPPAAARRDPPELLVILMDERSRVAGDIADRGRGHLVGVAQPAESAPGEDPMDGRGWSTEEWPEPVGPIPPGRSRGEDLGFGGIAQTTGRTMRSRRAIQEPVLALGPISADPLVRGRSADPELLGHVSDGPAQCHPPHQELATEDAQSRSRMSHESPLSVGALTPLTEHGDSRSVNDVFGDYS